MLATLVLFATLGIATPQRVGATAPDSVALARLADSLAAARMRDSVAGLVVGVYRNGRPLLRRAWGTGDALRERPLSPEAMLPIASITRQFVAAAVLRLVDEGRIALDAPAGQYLPQVTGSVRDVTVRQLLQLRSGLGRYEVLMRDRLDDATTDTVLAVIDSLPRVAEPGARFERNNANYYVLGAIIERVAGMRWDAWVTQALLAPLGLVHVQRCGGVDDGGHEGFIRLSTQAPRRRAIPIPVVVQEAAGALCATADDLAAWSVALHGGRVLSPSSYAALVTATGTDPNGGYAMGLLAQRIGGRRRFWHAGGITSGFDAQLAHYPDDSLTIVVLATTFPARPDELELTLARHLLGFTDAMPIAASDTARATYAGPPLPLAAFAGTYRADAMEFVVHARGDTLQVRDPLGRVIALARRDPTRFCGTQDTTFCLDFTIANGRAMALRLDSPRFLVGAARRVE